MIEAGYVYVLPTVHEVHGHEKLHCYVYIPPDRRLVIWSQTESICLRSHAPPPPPWGGKEGGEEEGGREEEGERDSDLLLQDVWNLLLSC